MWKSIRLFVLRNSFEIMKSKGNDCGIRPEKQIVTPRIYLFNFANEKQRSHQGIQGMKIHCFSCQNQLHWFPATLQYENTLSAEGFFLLLEIN